MDLPTTHYDSGSVSFKSNINESGNVNEKSETKNKGKSILEKVSIFLFFLGIFISPVIFVSSVYASLDLVKMITISLIILVPSILYIFSIIKARAIVLPRFALAYISILLLISIAISTFLSNNFSKSFIGQGFEIGTASFLFLMFLSAYLVSRIVVKDKDTIFNIYGSILLSFIILALFHISRIIGGVDFMSLGVLSNLSSTVIGKWYDLAILAGVSGLLSFLGIKYLTLAKGFKWLLSIFLIVCGAFLFIINSVFVWSALALISFCVGLYEFYSRPVLGEGLKKITSRISLLTLIVFIIASVCLWKGNNLTKNVIQSLNISQGELVLPWQLTLDVTADTIKESPFFGSGPNRFAYQFLRFKPQELNQTPFWSVEFNNGFAILPTFVSSLGLVGTILWILFFIFFIRDGIKILRKNNNPSKRFFITSSFFVASFLWIMNLIYFPSHVIVFFTFIFTGVFIGILVQEGFAREKMIGIISESKINKSSPIIYSLIIVVFVIWIGLYAKKTIAMAYFQKGIRELNSGSSADIAQNSFKKALSWNSSDINYQALSEINIVKINKLIQEIQSQSVANPSVTPDQKKVDQIINLINEALKYTESAIAKDPSNYYNFMEEARVSEIGVSLKIPQAYENAKRSYINALSVNPLNPLIYLNLARLEVSQNHSSDAKQLIGRALQLKQNYTEAVFLLSQIQVNEGQLKDALVSTQIATQLNPNEPLLFFQLGLLQYNDKNYFDAVTSLAKAVSLNSQYANARYFLGLSYARIGKNEEAISQFEELAKTNPDNNEVTFILTNLKAGKSPFNDVKPPIDSKPEKRKALPVTEKNTSLNGPSKTNTTSSSKTKSSN